MQLWYSSWECFWNFYQFDSFYSKQVQVVQKPARAIRYPIIRLGSVRQKSLKRTRFVSWVSIMKLWTCFSALVSSSFRDSSATRKAVHPAPCHWKQVKRKRHIWKLEFQIYKNKFLLRLLESFSILVSVVAVNVYKDGTKLTIIPVLTAIPRPQ